jgi:small subunit ribosomal protein S16
MLSIRLARTGKAHNPHYRIVVQEKRSKLNGGAIATIGHYHPATKGKELVIDQDQARHWLSKGAQASDTVTNLLVKVGVLDESKKIHRFYTPPVVSTPEANTAPMIEEEMMTPTEVEATEVVEAPVVAPEEETTEEVATEEEAADEETAA